MTREQWRLTAPPNRHAWGRILSDMNKPTRREYVVVVTNPEGWQSLYMTVSAASRDEARLRARGQLAVTRRDHWSVEIVLEAS